MPTDPMTDQAECVICHTEFDHPWPAIPAVCPQCWGDRPGCGVCGQPWGDHDRDMAGDLRCPDEDYVLR